MAATRGSERMSGRAVEPLTVLPEVVGPGYQGARCAADCIARTRLLRGSTQARSQQEGRTLLAGRVDISRPGWPPPLPPGAALGSRDPGDRPA